MEGAVKKSLSQTGGICAQKEPLGLRAIARAWQVPYATFWRRVCGTVGGTGHASGRHPVIPKEAEDDLVAVIFKLALVGFPHTRDEIRSLAYTYTESYNLSGF